MWRLAPTGQASFVSLCVRNMRRWGGYREARQAGWLVVENVLGGSVVPGGYGGPDVCRGVMAEIGEEESGKRVWKREAEEGRREEKGERV